MKVEPTKGAIAQHNVKNTQRHLEGRDRAAQFAKELKAGDINPRLYSTSSLLTLL